MSIKPTGSSSSTETARLNPENSPAEKGKLQSGKKVDKKATPRQTSSGKTQSPTDTTELKDRKVAHDVFSDIGTFTNNNGALRAALKRHINSASQWDKLLATLGTPPLEAQPAFIKTYSKIASGKILNHLLDFGNSPDQAAEILLTYLNVPHTSDNAISAIINEKSRDFFDQTGFSKQYKPLLLQELQQIILSTLKSELEKIPSNSVPSKVRQEINQALLDLNEIGI